MTLTILETINYDTYINRGIQEKKMNNTLRTILIVALLVVLGAGLFYGGMYFASRRYGSYGMMNRGLGPSSMMGNYGYSDPNSSGYGAGGMMDGGMMGNGYGGMMGGGGLTNADPISVEDAKQALVSYLAKIGDDDLVLKEIMVFDNGGYAIVSEKSTGIGAFELLIDPVSLTAFPEYGPNMMWNLKYGMMSGYTNNGIMGGMMGRWYAGVPSANISAEMPVSAEDAAQSAQKSLDAYLAGTKVSNEVTAFYGYYTIDVERDGKIVGMLSVNGYSGQVFLHTWHGDFIEMTEE
jgi:hypothetical protein